VTRRHWILLAILLVTGLVVLPVVAYVVAGRIIGPYAGARGLASYLGAIYADAGRGKPLALVMLLAPALCAGVWGLRAWFGRVITHTRNPA
jgi:hypothetical protein